MIITTIGIYHIITHLFLYSIRRENKTVTGNVHVKPSDIAIVSTANIPKIGKQLKLENLEIKIGQIDIEVTDIDKLWIEDDTVNMTQLNTWIERHFKELFTGTLKRLIKPLLLNYALKKSKQIALMHQ